MTADRQAKWTLAIVLACGCPGDSTPGGGTTGENASSTDGEPTGGVTASSDAMNDDTTAGPDTGEPSTTTEPTGTTGEPAGDTGDPPGPPLPCPDEWSCQADMDEDDTPIECDNAPWHANADQGDMDYDSFGDVVDLCPTVQGLNNTADSDNDGIGNACDVCPRPVSLYEIAGLAPADRVRNTPHQGDVDRDGVGDACDSCPLVPNCMGYGDGPGLTPWVPGFPLDPEDPTCNADADGDGIGDACEGMPGVGFASGDDFDGDGIDNGADPCVRVRAPDGGHPDPDGDGIGTECDVCPFVSDPSQADEDGDFVGDACEENAGCLERDNPRALGFYDVAVGGYCCTTAYAGQPLADPDGVALSVDDLPVTTPGLVELPPGCEAALADAGVDAATALLPADVGGVGEIWAYLCLLPAWDQDFDAVPDECDLCRYAYDPTNAPYVDSNGMVWPNDGAYCNGDYHCSNR